ncbi:MAG TPA: lipopolysaccharide heptosyltransferase I, partial [Burkholderiales bacterium]|nr:lipopolysaccharide heptosyltransferase I [Burkholderiales bacterium]
VIPVGVRRWRKDWVAEATRREIRDAKELFQAERYDLVVDTQGLLKSALLARWARGPICGCNWDSAREKIASLFYDRRVRLDWSRHAVERNRMIAALCLGYEVTTPACYGIRAPQRELPWLPRGPYAVLLHATSRADKLWPEDHWVALGERLLSAGLGLALPWGGEPERERAGRLAGRLPGAVVPPRLGLEDAAALLGGAAAVAGVDTGLSHLAAALGVPVVGIYCSTDPGSTGVHGASAINLGGVGRPPTPEEVAAALGRGGLELR